MLQKLQNEIGVNDKGVCHSSVYFKPYTLNLEESRKCCEITVVIVAEHRSQSFRKPSFP